MSTTITVPDTDPTNVGNFPGDGPFRAGGQLRSEATSTVGSGAGQDLPSARSRRAKKQLPAVQLVRDLWDGPEKMRERRELYLPKGPGEQQDDYDDRLKRSPYFNFFGRAIEGLSGVVFVKDVVLGDDVPSKIVDMWENIDNAGTHGDVFSRDLFEDSITAGHAGILVEFPRTGGAQTAADEFTIRPYWVPIKKENILSWRTTVENGRTILTQLVLEEVTDVPGGVFLEVEQTQYRVLFRQMTDAGAVIGFRVYQVMPDKKVIEVDQGLYANQVEIPFVEVRTAGQKSMLESKPPLIDMAYLNIAHYQQYSDYATSLHKTCVPILHLAGMTIADGGEGTGAVVVGPNAAITTPVDGKVEYVSHSGEALGACQVALEGLKSDMGALGVAMLAPQKRGAETAEAKRLDKSTTDSALGVAARALQDALERALDFTAKYLTLPSGGSCTVNRDFDDASMDAPTMQVYVNAVANAGLPVKMLLEAWQGAGRIGQDVDLDELEQEMLANAAAAAQAKAQALADSLANASAQGGGMPPRGTPKGAAGAPPAPKAPTPKTPPAPAGSVADASGGGAKAA